MPRPTIRKLERPSKLPLPSNARYFWQICRSGLYPEHVANDTHLVVRVAAGLDEAALEWSFQALLERHELLNARIDESMGTPQFHFDDSFAPKLDVRDMRRPSHGQRHRNQEDEALETVRELVWRPFRFDDERLVSEPLFRAFLIRLDSDYVFGMVFHHVIADMVSVSIAWRDITALYQSRVARTRPQLPELPIGYSDHVVSLNEWLSTDRGKEAISLLDAKASSCPPLVLPFDRAEREDFSADCVNFTVAESLVESLARFARTSRTGLFNLLLGAQAAVIMRRAGLGESIVKTVHTGRDQSALYGVVGFFSTWAPVKIVADDHSSYGSFVSASHAACEHVYCAVPFTVEQMSLYGSLRVCHSFNYVESAAATNGAGPVSGLAASMKYDVPRPTSGHVSKAAGNASKSSTNLIMTRVANSIAGRISYPSALYEKATVKRLVEELWSFLYLAGGRPGERLGVLMDQAVDRREELSSLVTFAG